MRKAEDRVTGYSGPWPPVRAAELRPFRLTPEDVFARRAAESDVLLGIESRIDSRTPFFDGVRGREVVVTNRYARKLKGGK